MTFTAADERILDRARASRDARFDGKFFIAVTSTKIYCRPICPVRAPRRENIRYYESAAAAAEAGYRPCLRCRPEAAPGSAAWLGSSAHVRHALRLIDAGFLDTRSVTELAKTIGVGSRQLRRLFLQHIGATPSGVAIARRLHFAKRLLDDTSLSITHIALGSGFGSLRRFNSAFRDTYHRPPSAIRRQRRDSVTETNEIVLELAYRPPYDWSHMLGFFAARAITGIEHVDGDSYSRTVPTKDGAAIIRVRHVPDRNALELRVSSAEPKSLLDISSTARRVFDLSADPERVRAALSADQLLAPLVERFGGVRIPGAWDPFECCVRAVLGQQVSVAAARTFVSRLVAVTGNEVDTDDPLLTHVFPTAQQVARADVLKIGITSARAKTLSALADGVASGRIDFSSRSEDIAAALTSVPGIGTWTASYVALRALGEPDAFPEGDLILRRAAGNADGPLSATALAERSEAWRPWRGYAAIHLWRSAATR